MKKFITYLAMLAIAGAASADVLLNFSQDSATAAPDSNGNYWNEFSDNHDNTTNSLITTANGASGWSMALSGLAGDADNSVVGTPSGNLASSNLGVESGTGVNPYIENFYSAGSGAVATMVFSGLTVGESYTFNIFGLRRQAADQWTQYTLAGGGTDVSTIFQTSYAGNLTPLDDIATLAQTADASGEIVFTWSGNKTSDFSGTGTYGHVNAIEIVPEPATVGMLGLGALIALLTRRMRA